MLSLSLLCFRKPTAHAIVHAKLAYCCVRPKGEVTNMTSTPGVRAESGSSSCVTSNQLEAYWATQPLMGILSTDRIRPLEAGTCCLTHHRAGVLQNAS